MAVKHTCSSSFSLLIWVVHMLITPLQGFKCQPCHHLPPNRLEYCSPLC